MRISDWSSDVCSSDLADDRRAREVRNRAPEGCDRAVQARFERRSWERCRHGMAFALLHAPAPICRGREADESGAGHGADERRRDRKRVVEGKRVSVRVDLRWGRVMRKKQNSGTKQLI